MRSSPELADFEVATVSVDGVEVASAPAPTTVMTALAAAERTHAAGADSSNRPDHRRRYRRPDAGRGGAGLQRRDGTAFRCTLPWARPPSPPGLSGLDARTTRHAFGLAVDQIGGTVQSIWDGASAWKIQQGTAARNGVYCAELAGPDWSGMADPLMAPFGLYGQFTPRDCAPGGC